MKLRMAKAWLVLYGIALGVGFASTIGLLVWWIFTDPSARTMALVTCGFATLIAAVAGIIKLTDWAWETIDRSKNNG